MSQVTVDQLAASVGTPVEKLLSQIDKAGLPQKKADEGISDDQKQTLLTFLKNSHGTDTSKPRKITIKRKEKTELKAAGAKGSVKVEVRKSRTFVKREDREDSKGLNIQATATKKRTAEDIKLEEAQARAAVERKKREAEKAKRAKQGDRKEAPKKQGERTADKSNARPAAARPSTPRPERPANAPRPARVDQATAQAAMEGKTPAKKKNLKKALPPGGAPNKAADARNKRGATGGKTSERNKGNRHQQIMGLVNDDGSVRRRKRKKQPKENLEHQFEKPTAPVIREVNFGEAISVQDLAAQMSVKGAEVIKCLFKMGVMATINQVLDQDTAILVTEEMGHKYSIKDDNAVENEVVDSINYDGEQVSRAPVVTIMGHVDHGKTSLLDHIRKTRVTAGESGGITQHIGAYHVDTPKGMITFLDTPGHAAFTAMRARGAKATDVVILVVAADDGVMPQTEEAIQHAKAAGVPLIVAINKMDKEGADVDRVTNELSQRDVLPESWGGDVPFVPVSAHTGLGIDELLDSVLLQAEMLELTAFSHGPAKGVVVESSLDKGRGSVATVLIQSGELKKGDIVLAGQSYGRVRALLDENRKLINEAGPSIPVEILGLDGTPDAGDDFMVVESEKQAREVSQFRRQKSKEVEQARQQASKLDQMFANMESGEVSTLNVVLKTDVRGSLEALTASLMKLGNDEVKVNVVTGGVGAITESDVNLALTANAVMFGFNVRASGNARELIEKHGIDLRYYSVIYDIIDDVKAALNGLLSPEIREEIVGLAEVRDVFRSPKFGSIAGSMVIEGTIFRNKKIRVLRDDTVIYEGELESLRRFKDDVDEVRNGTECGIGVKNYTDVKPGDKIEVFDVKEIARTIDD
jgi:translation initiation factor IF-2